VSTAPARALVEVGARLAARGLAHGASGNLSLRLDDGSLLVTPTGARLGALDADRLAHLEADGRPTGGDRPSKEWPLHVAIYAVRSDARAIVHLHSRNAVAVACLDDLPADDALPTYTAYQAMRVGRLRLVPFVSPGDPALGDAVAIAARDSRSLLLANHGLVAAGIDLEAASATAEEIEETCALHLLLAGRRVRLVPGDAAARLRGDERN
jgi:3-dehydro-4-phosphotetronate decarboxylase